VPTYPHHHDSHDVPVDLVDELLPPQTHSNLAKGVVWADIVADIAADEKNRQLPDVEPRQLPDAA
jgi:hypothetical protein